MTMTIAATADPSKPVAVALAELDREFGKVFAWWGKIYDRESGGFYYSLSAKESKKFRPDIEATCKGARVLDWTGAFDKASPRFRKGLVDYMQGRQDPESGFFADPQLRYSVNTRSRALGMAHAVLKLCGAEALHPLPYEKISKNRDAAAHYAHLESPDALRKWLEGLPWSRRAWTAGSRIRTQAGNFRRMKEPFRSQMLDELVTFLKTQQHADGLFRGKADYWKSHLSGTYKIVSCLDSNDREIPKVDRMRETILSLFCGKQYDNLIVLYNTANILEILNRRSKPFTDKEKVSIIKRCTAIIDTFHAPGGGFYTNRGKPAHRANGFTLARKVLEGDTNATGLAHKTRFRLHALATGKEKPTPHPRVVDFLEAIE